MSLAKNAEVWIDSVGALTDGTMTEVPCAISHDAISAWKSVTAPICRGDTFETSEGEVIQASIPLSLKFKKGDALQLRLRTAHLAGTQLGVLVSSGDKSVAGEETLTFNAHVETYTTKCQTGSHVIIDVTLKPHSASTTDPVYAVVSGS